MGTNPWIKKWSVEGSLGDVYTVGQRADGSYGCDCKGWKFKKAPKPDCKHIRAIKAALDTPAVVSAYDLQKEAEKAVQRTFTRVQPVRAICPYCAQTFTSQMMLVRHEALCRATIGRREKEFRSAYDAGKPPKKAPASAPKPQEVEVESDRFTVVRKFNFATE